MSSTARVTYLASPERLYQAALDTVRSLGYALGSSDPSRRTVAFNTGRSWRSWAGQDMTVEISPSNGSEGDGRFVLTVAGTRKQIGIQLVDWGELGSVQRKFLERFDAVLASLPEAAESAG